MRIRRPTTLVHYVQPGARSCGVSTLNHEVPSCRTALVWAIDRLAATVDHGGSRRQSSAMKPRWSTLKRCFAITGAPSSQRQSKMVA